jgi:hypothetical protein
MVAGINDALVDNGVVSWPNEAVGFEVCSKIAADLDGPDVLPEGGLSGESALLIGNRIKEASELLIANGYGQDPESALRTKQAAEMNFEDRAAMVAEACMSKAAAEASLTDVGPNTAESAAQTDQHAALDLKNRAMNKYLTGVGRTMFPSGGVIGQQMMAPERQSGPAISNSLTSLDKQANVSRREMAEYLAGLGLSPQQIAEQLGPEPRMDKLREGLGRAGGTIADYLGRIPTNPFAGAGGQGVLGGAKHIGGNLLRHPGTHAAALATALYGGNKLIKGLTADKADADAFMQAAADGGNAEMADYLASKQANEDMAAADLAEASDMTPGPTPGALQRAMMFLSGLKNRIPSFRPSPEAVAAASGLGEEGAPGMEVMAHLLDGVKTAEDAEAALQHVFELQVANEKTASVQLYEAVQEKVADEAAAAAQGAKEAPGALRQAGAAIMRNKLRTGAALAGTAAAFYGGKKYLDHRKAKREEAAKKEEESKAEEKAAALLEYLKQASEGEAAAKAVTDAGKEAPGAFRRAGEAVMRNKLRTGAALAGTAAAFYGGKKYLDHRKAKKEEAARQQEMSPKAASLLEYLKAAADGSLTDVGENTPESAALTDSVAELDMQNRSPNEYLMGVGKTRMSNKGQVYAVEDAGQDNPVQTHNLPTDETKSAELAYVNNFRKIAADLGPYLPATMSRDEKVAHLQTMLGLPPSERVQYVQALRAG